MKSLLTVLALLFASLTLTAETLKGRVVSVMDGDTIKALDAANTQYKIHLLRIDAPEKTQAFGQVSKKHLSEMVFSKEKCQL